MTQGRWHRAALVIATGLLAAGALATPPPPTGSRAGPALAAAELPARTLRVELRCEPLEPVPAREAAAAATQRSVGTAGGTPPAPGSVVVGTRERREPGPVVALRSASARPQAPVLLQLRVANGQLARWQAQSETREPVLDFAWVEGVRPPAPAASAGVGVALRETVRRILQELQVRPRWPGPGHAVQLWLAARQAGPREAGATSAGDAELALETTLQVPLGRWVPVAHSADPAPGASGGLAWQLRVTAETE